MRDMVSAERPFLAVRPPSAKMKGKESSSRVDRRAVTYSGVVTGKKWDLKSLLTLASSK